MKRVRNHLLSVSLGVMLMLSGATANIMLAAQPVSALSLPVTVASDAGKPCALPDDLAGAQSGVILGDGYTCCPQKSADGSSCLFAKYINPLIQLLSALVGMAVVISIIYGGIQYVTSTGDPQRTEAGKKRIIESLVGLAAFMLLYAFLQYILPGGVLNAH